MPPCGYLVLLPKKRKQLSNPCPWTPDKKEDVVIQAARRNSGKARQGPGGPLKGLFERVVPIIK